MLAAPGTWSHAFVVVLAVCTLWSVSVPGFYLGLHLLCGVGWLVAFGSLALRLLATLVRRRRVACSLGWLVVPMAALCTWVLFGADAAKDLRWRASAGALSDVAQAVLQGETDPDEVRGLVGLMPVHGVEVSADPRNPGLVHFVLPTHVQLVYSPDGVPLDWDDGDSVRVAYQHLEGPWYTASGPGART